MPHYSKICSVSIISGQYVVIQWKVMSNCFNRRGNVILKTLEFWKIMSAMLLGLALNST